MSTLACFFASSLEASAKDWVIFSKWEGMEGWPFSLVGKRCFIRQLYHIFPKVENRKVWAYPSWSQTNGTTKIGNLTINSIEPAFSNFG